MSDDCSALPLPNPHFSLLFSLSLQPLDRFLSSKMLAYSPNSSFTLLRSRQNKMYTKIALFSQSLLFLLSFSLSVLALFLSSFSVRLSVDIPGVHWSAFSFSPSFYFRVCIQKLPFVLFPLTPLSFPLILPALREITIFVHLSEVCSVPSCYWHYVASFPSFFFPIFCLSFSNHSFLVLFLFAPDLRSLNLHIQTSERFARG